MRAGASGNGSTPPRFVSVRARYHPRMATTPLCTNCGARSAELDARFCGFCGHELPRDEPAPASPPDASSVRLTRLREHPDYARLMAHEPSLTTHRLGAVASVLFLVAFLSIGGILMVPAMMFPPMLIPLFAILGFGVFVVGSALRGNAAVRGGELVRVPAHVVDERTEVVGGGDSSVSTHYFVSLESERGSRAEYEVDAGIASRVAPGDVGVAYFKGPLLVDFRRPNG